MESADDGLYDDEDGEDDWQVGDDGIRLVNVDDVEKA
jgi:hypothetical protein